MKHFLSCLIVVIITSGGIARSQESPRGASETLENLFNRLVDNYSDQERIQINDSIRTILEGYAKSDSVFRHTFENLRYLGQITSPDSLIKIITWNLVLENEPGRYYCFLVRKMGDSKQNKVYPLSAKYNPDTVRTDTTYNTTNWYGALYYDLRPVIIDGRREWILLGIDYGNAEISRKIIEVLDFKDDDSLSLGRNWFIADEKKSYRIVLEYASNSMMTLRFRSGTSVIFDHLAPFSSSHQGDHRYYGPDYSFDTYDFNGTEWKLNLNVDARNK